MQTVYGRALEFRSATATRTRTKSRGKKKKGPSSRVETIDGEIVQYDVLLLRNARDKRVVFFFMLCRREPKKSRTKASNTVIIMCIEHFASYKYFFSFSFVFKNVSRYDVIL